jgi:hypothetical protein
MLDATAVFLSLNYQEFLIPCRHCGDSKIDEEVSERVKKGRIKKELKKDRIRNWNLE